MSSLSDDAAAATATLMDGRSNQNSSDELFPPPPPPSLPPPPPPVDSSSSSLWMFATNFQEGCQYLCHDDDLRRPHQEESVVVTTPPSCVRPDFLSQVTVSFIDPTTSSIMMSSSSISSTTSTSTSTSSGTVGYSAAVKKAQRNQSIQLFETFQRIFATQYPYGLPQVPYQLFRNAATGEIPWLPIRTVVTRGHGGFLVTDDATTTTTTTSSSSSPQHRWTGRTRVHGDYSWEQPYCYVYLAACDNLDHYRTKVKPSIQVFISQLEASIKATSSSSSSAAWFRRSRSNPMNDTTTTTTTLPSHSNGNTDTSMDESINGGGGGGLDVSTTTTNHPSKRNKRIPPAPRYVIIYIPTSHATTTDPEPISPVKPNQAPTVVTTTTTSTTTTTTSSGSNSSSTTTSVIGASVVSRLAAARQRMTLGRTATTTSEPATGEDTATTTTTTTDVTEDELLGSTNNNHNTAPLLSAPIQQLNRMEREIARRLVNDFPAGNVCTLSTLFDAATTTNHPTESRPPPATDHNILLLQQLEWQAVAKAMGNAIMASFHDRCQRYDDEIRLIDQKRRGAGPEALTTPSKASFSSDGLDETTTTGGGGGDGAASSTVDDLHLCHFFLLKENLAFTYEQMRLPSEAMLQYEELRAFLPDRNEATTTMTPATLSSMITALNDQTINNGSENDDLNRQELIDLALRGNILEFRRLLKMHGDVATIQQVADEYLFAREIALLFQLRQPVRIMRRCYTYVQSTFDAKKRQIDEMDISKEFRQKLIELYQWAFCFCWYIKSGSDCLFADESMAKSSDYVACARCVCDILEFARNCLERFGDLVLSQSDVPLRPYGREYVKSLQHPWTPWQAPIISDLPNKSPVRFTNPQELLKNAMVSRDAFTDRYCDLLDTIATCHEYCGRRRYAARLRMDRVDILDAKDDKVIAAKEILSIFTLYRSDQWNACYFAQMLRLAGFQRVTANPPEYLDTLVRCFYRGVHDVAPPKALRALHIDLVSVMQHASVEGTRYAAASLFGPSFGLEGMESSVLPGSDRSLMKKLYTLGDTIRVNLTLNSYLSDDIEVDSISINLVPFPKYVAAMEDNILIPQEDVHHVVKFCNVTLSSGANVLQGEWQPESSGQFIIASVCILWGGVAFAYTAKEIRRPTIRIDVVACAPSQTLDITPKLLLVGQEQPIQINLNANNDCVIDGTLLIEGPPNALFRNHDSGHIDANEWVPSLEIATKSCDQNQTVSSKVFAKIAATADSELATQFVRVNLSTTYKYANMDLDNAMQASLDAAIEILDKSAFTVNTCDLISNSNEKVVINTVLECNCPSSLTLKSWSIDLPSCYILTSEGDMNDSLANETVCCGDRMSFTFDCTYDFNLRTSGTGSTVNAILHVVFENEMGAQLQESMNIRLKSPIGVALKALEANPSILKIETSLKESVVGLPVDIMYKLELSELNITSETLSYEISTDHADWIIIGKTVGIINATANKPLEVTIIAIPIRPGLIQEYPSLSLMYLSDTAMKAIPISIATTEPFTSLSTSDHTSMAFFVGRVSDKQ